MDADGKNLQAASLTGAFKLGSEIRFPSASDGIDRVNTFLPDLLSLRANLR